LLQYDLGRSKLNLDYARYPALPLHPLPMHWATLDHLGKV
jgi:hypothetical protein